MAVAVAQVHGVVVVAVVRDVMVGVVVAGMRLRVVPSLTLALRPRLALP